jgi:hypothetical protein
MKTVRDVTYQLVPEFGLTTIFDEAVALADAVGAPVRAAPSLAKDAPVSRAIDRAGHILVVQSWADCITNIAGFNFTTGTGLRFGRSALGSCGNPR